MNDNHHAIKISDEDVPLIGLSNQHMIFITIYLVLVSPICIVGLPIAWLWNSLTKFIS